MLNGQMKLPGPAAKHRPVFRSSADEALAPADSDDSHFDSAFDLIAFRFSSDFLAYQSVLARSYEIPGDSLLCFSFFSSAYFSLVRFGCSSDTMNRMARFVLDVAAAFVPEELEVEESVQEVTQGLSTKGQAVVFLPWVVPYEVLFAAGSDYAPEEFELADCLLLIYFAIGKKVQLIGDAENAAADRRYHPHPRLPPLPPSRSSAKFYRQSLL